MKGGKRPLGYTIIEVMIVLLISGVMFLIASEFIGGKEQTTAFTQGVNTMASQIQNTIQEVIAGQYSDIPLSCTFNGVGSQTIPGIGTNSQGTNPECVFLGKIIRFTGQNSPNYEVISLAGGQIDPSTLPASTTQQQLLNDAWPAVICSGTSCLTTTDTIQQQINVVGMCITPLGSASCSADFYNIGFIQSLGTPNGEGSFQSGAQPISMVYSPVTTPSGESYPSTADNLSINHNVDYAQSATICLSDSAGTTSGQLAKLIIGSNNNQYGVTVQRVNAGTPCP
jgi:prepilin-type N-terminal cleavage/methylation domain-containing protein